MIDKTVNVSKIKLKYKRRKFNSEKQPKIEVMFSWEYAEKSNKSSHSIVKDSLPEVDL